VGRRGCLGRGRARGLASRRREWQLRIVRNGETRWLHMTGLCVRDEGARAGAVGRLGQRRDERKNAEEERAPAADADLAAEKAARAGGLRVAIGAGDDRIAGRPTWKRWTGWRPAATTGLRCWKRCAPGRLAGVRRDRVRAGNGGCRGEYRVLHKGGAFVDAVKGRCCSIRRTAGAKIVRIHCWTSRSGARGGGTEDDEAQLRLAQRLEARARWPAAPSHTTS